jgi:hypothetical protein
LRYALGVNRRSALSDTEIVSETADEISTGTAGVMGDRNTVEAIQNASAVPFHNLGASVAVLVPAMTISLTPLGRTARTFDDNPVVGSMLGRNSILPLSASSSGAITYSIER